MPLRKTAKVLQSIACTPTSKLIHKKRRKILLSPSTRIINQRFTDFGAHCRISETAEAAAQAWYGAGHSYSIKPISHQLPKHYPPAQHTGALDNDRGFDQSTLNTEPFTFKAEFIRPKQRFSTGEMELLLLSLS